MGCYRATSDNQFPSLIPGLQYFCMFELTWAVFAVFLSLPGANKTIAPPLPIRAYDFKLAASCTAQSSSTWGDHNLWQGWSMRRRGVEAFARHGAWGASEIHGFYGYIMRASL
jgi:hypothetical protein